VDIEEILANIELNKTNNLNIIKSVGLERDENVYSDIIVHLLKSNAGVKVINNLLTHFNIIKADSIRNEEIYTVLREYHRIDITIVFQELKLIIGIENKIDAEEQPTQLKRYQKIFDKYYSNYKATFFFLTPNGRSSLTSDRFSKTPCFSLSYSTLVKVMTQNIFPDEITQAYITTFTNCIRNEIIMEQSKNENLHEIWGKFRNRILLNEITKNRPGIFSIKEKLIENISDYLKSVDDEINEIWEYPRKYPAKELDIWPQYFCKKKIPIAFMFYDIEERENLPCMRIVIWKDNFQKLSSTRLKDYQTKNENFAFEPIRGWSCWISLYAGRNFSPDYLIESDHDYGEGLVKLFTEKFISEYKELKKYI